MMHLSSSTLDYTACVYDAAEILFRTDEHTFIGSSSSRSGQGHSRSLRLDKVLSCVMVYVDYVSLRVYIGSFAVFRNFENFEIDIALAEYCSQQIQVFHQLSPYLEAGYPIILLHLIFTLDF